MPHDQETSFRNDPATSDDPLYREPSDGFRDVPASDQDQDDLDGTDSTDSTGATPIGDELTSRHAAPLDASTDASTTGAEPTPPNGIPASPAAVSDTPGEWVAGSKGPDYAAHDGDSVDSKSSSVRWDPVTSEAPAATEDSATGTTADAYTSANTDAPETAEDPGATDTPAISVTTDAPATTEAPLTSDTSEATGTPAGVTSPGTPATPVPGAPGTAKTAGVTATSFVTNGDELHDDWARIQSAFVDDPRGSVSQAADLVNQVTSSLVAAVQQREQALRGEWESEEGTDTEHLRNALRDYRAYFEQLVKL
jgi:hypothetical protein